jgi:hypothetical protein
MLRVLGLVVLMLVLASLLGGCGGTAARLAPGGARDTAAVTTSLTAVADTSLYEGAPSGNYGTLVRLYAGNYPDKKARRALIRFDLSRIPVGATVTKATLLLYVQSVYQGADTYTVHRVTKSWSETKATWSNMGTEYAAAVASSRQIALAAEKTTVRFPVRGLVRNWAQNRSQNFGCLVRGTEGSTPLGIVLGAREYLTPAYRPRLEVTYTP